MHFGLASMPLSSKPGGDKGQDLLLTPHHTPPAEVDLGGWGEVIATGRQSKECLLPNALQGQGLKRLRIKKTCMNHRWVLSGYRGPKAKSLSGQEPRKSWGGVIRGAYGSISTLEDSEDLERETVGPSVPS